MNERSKVILFFGLFIPFFILIVFGGAGYWAYSDISNTWQARKEIYDKMLSQKKTLEETKGERAIYDRWLPTFRSWYHPDMLSHMARMLTNRCVEENGLKLISASERQPPTLFPGAKAQSFTFLGRTGSMIEFIGDSQVQFPSIYPESWEMTKDAAKGFVNLNITFVLPENKAVK
jgi:hypothetical protein